MAVLIVHLTPILHVDLSGQRQVPSASQRVCYALRTHSPEFVREAQVDVVQEPTLARTIVPDGIKRLRDVFLATLPVLGRGREVPQVDQEVLRPVFQVLRLRRLFRVLPDPKADVMRIPQVQLVEVFRDDESIASGRLLDSCLSTVIIHPRLGRMN